MVTAAADAAGHPRSLWVSSPQMVRPVNALQKKIVQILFYRCRYRCFVSQIIYTINRDTASPEGGSVCLGDMTLPHLKEVSPVIMM